MKKEIVNIVLTGDENYVMPMGVAMFSIVKNLPKNKTARFFLLVSGWKKNEETEIRKLKNCVIEIIHVEKYFDYFKSMDVKKFKLNYIKSLVPYYRLLIPKILPNDVKDIFYFDADMVADADISQISNYVSKDTLMAAVIELVANVHHEKVLSHVKTWKEFDKFNKNRFDAPYFNAGFFWMNLNMAKKLNIFDDFMDFLKKHPNPPYADQDTLNAVCGQKYSDKMMYLHPKWNVFGDMNFNAVVYSRSGYPHHMIQSAFTFPFVCHFAGPNKPWVNDKCSHFFNIWHNYFNFSPFKRPLPELNLSAINGKKYWINVFGVPLIKVYNTEEEYKSSLFGFLPIKRCYSDKKKFYFFGIPLIKLLYTSTGKFYSGYLFHFLPIINVKKDK